VSATFEGPLRAHFEDFATLMRSTGGRHVPLLANLVRFDRFLAQAYPYATTITKEILHAWFASFEHLRPSSQGRYRTATFQICKFLRRRNASTATREDILSPRLRRDFHPYIFTAEEISRLLHAAGELSPTKIEPLRPWSMQLVVVLLYTAGLRIGEVVRFQVRDYQASDATLVVRETKFAKTRMVALSSSARRVVDEYLVRRRDLGLSCEPVDPLRCCPSNRPPCLDSVQAALVRVMRDCGLKPTRGRRGPRIHDIRHSFAVHRVLEWYRRGEDVQLLLPRLVTYMGHRGLESTQRYLSLTPAVLVEASARFEKFAVPNVPVVEVKS
jgi:site-specific recombinase XerD